MHDTIIVRYAEIALKGKNRADFEKRLVENIRATLKNLRIGFQKIIRKRGRILIATDSKADELRYVPGIASFSYALTAMPSMDSIIKASERLIQDKEFTSFRVSAKRIDKSAELNSNEVNIRLGEHIRSRYSKKVSLNGYDLDIGVELIDRHEYIFTEKIAGYGGLPIGSTGRVLVVLDSKRSLYAAKLMMKRGCRVILISGTAEISQTAKETAKISQTEKTGQAKEKKHNNDMNDMNYIDVTELERYNNYERLNVISPYAAGNQCKDTKQKGFSDMLRENKASAVVVSNSSDELHELGVLFKNNRDVLILAPLICTSRDDVGKITSKEYKI
ncbi:hypothetical protein JXB31_01195 [Candidatus Woesearchaeota archaeon]|nr:hypothetical protein [Candidatus Woesearchaeota archaeon]